MMTKRVVHIVDDDPAVRRSASFILKTSGYAVVLHDSGEEFLKAVNDAVPGCVLLDIRMPGLDGLQVQKLMAERGVAFPVVILTGHGDVAITVKAMKAGAVDLLEKPFEKTNLLDAIAAAFKQMDDAAANADRAWEASIRIAGLTIREQDVLRGLASGLPNKTIARDLEISPRTVEVHRANLMAKLKVHSLSEALRIAFSASLHLSPLRDDT